MLDVQAADTWVNEVLSASTDLTGLLPLGAASIYNQIPPAGVFPPYVIFSGIPAADTTTNGYVFVGANFNYSVQAVISDTEGGKPLTDACAQAIYDAMFTIGVAENGFWITCSRAKPINLAPQLKNRPFRYGGGTYTV